MYYVMNTCVQVFTRIEFVFDSMVSVDARPLNRWRWNITYLVLYLLVNG